MSELSSLSEMRAKTVLVEGIDEKIELIKKEIERGKREPVIRELVARILARKVDGEWAVKEKDWEAEVKALFNYVKNAVRYTRDIYAIDTFQRAIRTLQLNIGDCDDQVILLGSMLQAAGYPIALKVVDTKGYGWDHIYLLVGLPPISPVRWVPLDTTVDKPPGWEVSNVVAYRVYPVGGSPAPLGAAGDDRVKAPWWAWLALFIALFGFLRRARG